MRGTLNDSSFKVLGTAHDDEWRKGRWTWKDPEIDEPAQRVLSAFSEKIVITGELTDFGVQETLAERELHNDEVFHSQIARDGLNTFFFVRHLVPASYMQDAEGEIARIRAVRQAMKDARK